MFPVERRRRHIERILEVMGFDRGMGPSSTAEASLSLRNPSFSESSLLSTAV